MGLRCVYSRKPEKRSGICRCKTVRRDRNRHRLTGRNWICAGFGGETKAERAESNRDFSLSLCRRCRDRKNVRVRLPSDQAVRLSRAANDSERIQRKWHAPRAGEDQTSFGSEGAA